MQITVADAKIQTTYFLAIFVLALVLSVRGSKRTEIFPMSLTKGLKGFAMLTVIFAHIGYALSNDNAFLQPLSYVSGVGVNVFLFLSGLGLCVSAEKSSQSPKEFYWRRFKAVLVPLWIALTLTYLADFIFLKANYPLVTVVESYLGMYLSSNMYTEVNSPLWYLTFLFSYYLVFPILFRKNRPYVSAFLVFAFGLVFGLATRSFIWSAWLFVLHCIAFPLGMVAAQLLKRVPKRPVSELIPLYLRIPLVIALASIAAYTTVYSGVGQWTEQPISIISTLAVIGLFAIMPVRFVLFDLVGLFSYEIYLLHWPLMYRYDFLYKLFPPYLATALYIPYLLLVGFTLQQLTTLIMMAIGKRKIATKQN